MLVARDIGDTIVMYGRCVMVPAGETLDIMKTNELSGLLGDLSFSYMEVYSSRQSLKDLKSSIESLRSLVEGLEAEVGTSCSVVKL